jgi:hypothetical protein
MGKSQPQTQTTDTSQHVPQWLESAGENAVNRAETLSNRDYDPYYGDYVAPQTNDTFQSYQQVRDLQGRSDPAFAGSMGAYQGLLGQAAPQTADQANALSSSLYGNFQQNAYNPAQQLLNPYLRQGPATAAQVGSNATQLMSPYSAQVIAPTLAAGEQAREIARQKIAGNAQNVGAFGGSRQGVAEGVSDAQNALGTQQQIGQMLQQGWGQALTPAAQLAMQGGQQAYGAAGLLGNLGARGYETAAQQGQGIANQNLQAGLAAASGLPQVGSAYQKYGQTDASLLQAAGAAEQGWTQANINAAMGQHFEEQNWPVQNLDLYLAALGGVPYSTTGTGASTRNLTKNVAGGALGGAASGASIGMAAGPYGAAAGAAIGGLLGALG